MHQPSPIGAISVGYAEGRMIVKITMVEKIMPDGSLCPKCKDVIELLQKRGVWDRIDQVLDVSPNDKAGEGIRLVKKHKVKQAPFFIVERDGEGEVVYKSVLQMLNHLFPQG